MQHTLNLHFQSSLSNRLQCYLQLQKYFRFTSLTHFLILTRHHCATKYHLCTIHTIRNTTFSKQVYDSYHVNLSSSTWLFSEADHILPSLVTWSHFTRHQYCKTCFSCPVVFTKSVLTVWNFQSSFLSYQNA